MNDLTLVPALVVAVPVILGVVSVFKKMGLPSKLAPALSLVFGLVLAFFVGGLTTFDIIMQGLVVGLSSAGLYSGTKATLK